MIFGDKIPDIERQGQDRAAPLLMFPRRLHQPEQRVPNEWGPRRRLRAPLDRETPTVSL